MNVTDVAYDTVHQHPGGSVALAPRMGMSDATLRGKVNPNTDRNLLSLQEADALMGKTGDFRILQGRARTTPSRSPRRPPAGRTTSTCRSRAGAAVAAVAWRQERTNEHDRAGQGQEEAAHSGREP